MVLRHAEPGHEKNQQYHQSRIIGPVAVFTTTALINTGLTQGRGCGNRSCGNLESDGSSDGSGHAKKTTVGGGGASNCLTGPIVRP